MSKNIKKTGSDSLGADPRNKNNYNSQSQLMSKPKKSRIPPPVSISLEPRKESSNENTQNPSKQWTSVAPNNATATAKSEWTQVGGSQPYQHPVSRNSVSTAEFPTLSSGNAPQKGAKPRFTERPPKKLEEESHIQRRTNSPLNESLYPPHRSGDGFESRYQGGQGRQSNYHTQRPNQGSSRNNSSYNNRSGQQVRNRSNFPPYNMRSQQAYNRDESVPEMFAGADTSHLPLQARSVPIKHADFDLDIHAAGWAGKQNEVDYQAKIIFEDSGDEEERSLIPLTKISAPKDIPERSGRISTMAASEAADSSSEKQRDNSPGPQTGSNPTLLSPLGMGKPFQIKKRPISDSIPDPSPSETPHPELPTQQQPQPPTDEIPSEPVRRPQQVSMRHEVPNYLKDPTSDSSKSETTKQPVSAPRPREDAWKQNHPSSFPIPTPSQGDAHNVTPKDSAKNFWEGRINEKGDQLRQELPGFPKLGENGPVQSCVITPSKSEKQEFGRGRGRYHDDNVFEEYPQERGYHSNQWERGDRGERRSDDRRGPGRQNMRPGRSEYDKNQNWRRESNDMGSRGGRGERGRNDREDRFESERFNRSERYGRDDGFRNDRFDRHDKFDRFDRSDRSDRNNRSERNDRFENNEKFDRNDGFDRNRRDRDQGRGNREERRDFQERDREWGNRNQGSGQRYSNRRGDSRPSDRGRGDMGSYRDDDRNRKSSEGRWGSQSGPAANGFSYASAVSHRGESDSREGTFEQEGDIRPTQSLPSGEFQGKGPDSRQDNWRRQERAEGPAAPGHMKYNNQKKGNQPSVSEQDGRDRPSSRNNDQPARETEWPEDTAPREPGLGSKDDADANIDSGFIEIRNKNKSKGRGLSSGEASDGPRPSMGRGRGRAYYDSHGQEGGPGARWSNGKNSSVGADPRFSRGGSPQKSQGMGRARIPEKQSQVSPKRSGPRGSDSEKRSARLSVRAESPPALQPVQKHSGASGGASSHYVTPGLSFSAIASKNIEKPLPPAKPAPESTDENEASSLKEKVDQEVESKEDDEIGSDSAPTPINSFTEPLQAEELAAPEPGAEKRDEPYEVISTTIVNSNMVDEVAEIDQATRADLLAHTEPKEEVTQSPEGDALDWSVKDEKSPTPTKEVVNPRKSPPVEQISSYVKPEEHVSIATTEIPTPGIQTTGIPTSIPIPETRKVEPKQTTMNPPPGVFPDPSHLMQAGMNPTDWYNNHPMATLDVSASLPFPYSSQQPITDDDKAVRSKQSDLADYVNAPEFLPSYGGLQSYQDYAGSLASANFMSPPFAQDFSQAQLALSSLPPTLDTSAAHSGLLAAPRVGSLTLPPHANYQPQISLGSAYPNTAQIMPGTLAPSPLRPPNQQFVRQVSAQGMPTSPSYSGYGMHGNMRTAVMSMDNSRRNDKINMGEKGPNSHNPMYNFNKKWDPTNQYNGQLRKNAPSFTPVMHQNVRNYSQNTNRGNYFPRAQKKGYVKYPQQPLGIIQPHMQHHPFRPAPNQFISLVGPVRPQQMQHGNQLRNSNYPPYKQKNGPYNNFNRQALQGNYIYANRTSPSGPQITSVSAPSIEAVMIPPGMNQPNLNYQMQSEADLSKNMSMVPKYNIQMQMQNPLVSHKFQPYSSEAGAEDNLASEYSKIGPVAVNGRNNPDFRPEEVMNEKMAQGIPENQMFATQVPNRLTSESNIQQTNPAELKIKSHSETSGSSPPTDSCQSVMDIYGPAPLVSSSNLVSSSEALIQNQSIPADELSSGPTFSAEKAQEEQAQPQVNLEP